MKNRPGLLTSAAIALIALTLAVLTLGRAVASDATPPATPQPIAIADLGSGLPTNGPGQTLALNRITIQPGAAFPVHTHPGAYVIYVESGDFTFSVIKGEALYTPAGSTTSQTIAAGQQVTGHVGDVIFEQEGVVHTAAAAGNQPAVVLTASLLATGVPFMQMTNDQGTPTP